MKRNLAIGDIHGCYDALRLLCEFVELRTDDTIILLRSATIQIVVHTVVPYLSGLSN